jgi:hypothetical protein
VTTLLDFKVMFNIALHFVVSLFTTMPGLEDAIYEWTEEPTLGHVAMSIYAGNVEELALQLSSNSSFPADTQAQLRFIANVIQNRLQGAYLMRTAGQLTLLHTRRLYARVDSTALRHMMQQYVTTMQALMRMERMFVPEMIEDAMVGRG